MDRSALSILLEACPCTLRSQTCVAQQPRVPRAPQATGGSLRRTGTVVWRPTRGSNRVRLHLSMVTRSDPEYGSARWDRVCLEWRWTKFTDVFPEDRDFGLNVGRKSQNGGWVIGVVGGDDVKSNIMSEWGSAKAMVTTKVSAMPGLSSNALVYIYARFQGRINVQGAMPCYQQANTRETATGVTIHTTRNASQR